MLCAVNAKTEKASFAHRHSAEIRGGLICPFAGCSDRVFKFHRNYFAYAFLLHGDAEKSAGAFHCGLFVRNDHKLSFGGKSFDIPGNALSIAVVERRFYFVKNAESIGRSLKMANNMAIQVKALSPPESREIFWSFFPGG